MSDWKPNYSNLEPSEPVQIPKRPEPPITRPATSEDIDWKSEQERMRTYRRTPAPAISEPRLAFNWINWVQRIAIAILICIVAWLIYRSEFAPPIVDSPEIRIDFADMDQAANEARSQVFEEVAGKAGEFKDLQALVDWQDERLRASRLQAYQPWIELLTRELDEDRYDPKVAERIFRAAAQASRY